jgi:hypothetical protein
MSAYDKSEDMGIDVKAWRKRTDEISVGCVELPRIIIQHSSYLGEIISFGFLGICFRPAKDSQGFSHAGQMRSTESFTSETSASMSGA